MEPAALAALQSTQFIPPGRSFTVLYDRAKPVILDAKPASANRAGVNFFTLTLKTKNIKYPLANNLVLCYYNHTIFGTPQYDFKLW